MQAPHQNCTCAFSCSGRDERDEADRSSCRAALRIGLTPKPDAATESAYVFVVSGKLWKRAKSGMASRCRMTALVGVIGLGDALTSGTICFSTDALTCPPVRSKIASWYSSANTRNESRRDFPHEPLDSGRTTSGDHGMLSLAFGHRNAQPRHTCRSLRPPKA